MTFADLFSEAFRSVLVLIVAVLLLAAPTACTIIHYIIGD